jgi:Ring finger domain
MAVVDIDSGLFEYTAAFAPASILDQEENSPVMQGEEVASHYFGSMVVTLLFVPFSIYFSIVLLIFALECYQFFAVWRMVSRTRAHDGGVPRLFRAQQAWNSRYHGLNSDDDVPIKDHHYTEHEIEKHLFVREYTAPGDANSHDNCPICLGDFQLEESVASIRGCHCNALFHHSCLNQWLCERPSCPYCRLEILPPSPTLPTLPLSESLELASLQLEQYVCNALTIFGEFVSSYTG